MIKQDNASFRDPAGHIYWQDGAIYRSVMPCFASEFDTVRQTGAIDDWIAKGLLWPEKRVPNALLDQQGESAHAVLTHPIFPFISYPYEWSFALLKEAALFHLDLMLEALSKNIMLNDASAFNIQFNGTQPIFIDHLAFRPYVDGEFWQAHKQFFEQFINPLLLQAYCSIAFQPWYRGTLNGIATVDLAKLLPLQRKWHWQVACHIVLQAHFDKRPPVAINKLTKQSTMSRAALENLWRSLRRWVAGLQDALPTTHWQSYASTHSYSDQAMISKKAFITDFIAKNQPDLVWDLGCNTGVFSFVALEAGAKRVIGFDNDQGALDFAFEQAKKQKLAFTPLYMNLLNPTPSQGWCEKERLSLSERTKPNVILALALVHHLAITGNVPLPMIIDYLLSFAPSGVIEFIPKTDPMVQAMLARRRDIFVDYTWENFIQLLSNRVTIVSQLPLSEKGRILVSYISHKGEGK